MTVIKPDDIVFYSDTNGKQPFLKWLNSLDSTVKARIDQRLLRLSLGNYGDYKFLDEGVYELKFKFGPGYRIYFGKDGNKIVVLLNGGDKKTQNKDIKIAIEYWSEYKENKNE